MDDYNAAFIWKEEPVAEELTLQLFNHSLQRHSALQQLDEQLHQLTSTRLFDWVDHLVTADSPEIRSRLQEAGYEEEGVFSKVVSFRHLGAQLPTIVLGLQPGVAISVDSISDFLMVRGLQRDIDGSLYSPYRRSLIEIEQETAFWIVERRGTRTMEASYPSDEYVSDYLTSKELWKTRSRNSLDDAIRCAKELVDMMGRDLAAWIVCEVEREYWQSRNRAGHIQKGRQDRLGMGWANHDHHTFRSSRDNFPSLVSLFELLGFQCRERFYAGEEAGWGAQVMENSISGLILFLDVDLKPEEVAIDFAHEALPPEDELGTIGLWCGLHGDSILEAGMHHLELQFNFDDLRRDLDALGVGMMAPFSDFDYLKQAFTQGEMWPVDPQRGEALLNQGYITSEQAEKFQKDGAVGSHMENLQRRKGYKGFNQKNVSNIIKRTDPRTLTSKS